MWRGATRGGCLSEGAGRLGIFTSTLLLLFVVLCTNVSRYEPGSAAQVFRGSLLTSPHFTREALTKLPESVMGCGMSSEAAAAIPDAANPDEALELALRHADKEALQKAIDTHANVNKIFKDSDGIEYCALHMAAKLDCPVTIQKLVKIRFFSITSFLVLQPSPNLVLVRNRKIYSLCIPIFLADS
ncbi:hypothetical protein E2C01_036289 [Portunus trituberculatus]|uniref:Uncharacterized protein n=1 Tax=Portunus trituberculatus TaxID=210409 RepID=A0A5B7F8C2_PORTR|nr:hypothetical protein [Portunus trituberculatus]